MSNAELWDLDTSGGIMEQIQMLVAPPVSAEALRRSRRRREIGVYRRPGKAANHDACDSCKEGGDLICCDQCPAAFHLLCHDPPLIEEELPTGEWLCHRCKLTPQETNDDDAESTSSKSSSRSIRGKRTAAAGEIDGKRSSTNGEPDTKTEHPLKTLVKAARLMNPVQFDLGKEITCTKPLPGSSKRVYGKPVKHVTKKQAHELDNGLVPLPAKTCFTCTKSCRVAPLIQCDYCPLLFHLDCLNPPLTSLPTGRWMCPNHVEHFLDSCLLKSQSLTERLRLWDRYTGLVNSHTIKVDFLNKVHTKNPTFRYKRKLPSRSTISVPPAIKHFYKSPPTLLPDPARPIPSTNVSINQSSTYGNSTASLEEQEEWLLSVVSMQASIAKYLAQKQLQSSVADCAHKFTDSSSSPAMSKPTASVAPVVYKDFESSSAQTIPSLHLDSVNKQLSSSSLLPSNNSELFDCDIKPLITNNMLLNGEQKSISNSTSSFLEDKNSMGPNFTLDIPSTRSVMSLLTNNITRCVSNSPTNMSSVNGIKDSEVQSLNSCSVQRQVSDCVLTSRNISVDALSSSSTDGLGNHWMSGENINGDRSSCSNNDSCKNTSNTAVIRSVSTKSHPAKVVLSSNKASVLNNNLTVGAAGTQVQRVSLPPSVKLPTTPAITGSTHKVITVSATPSGRTFNNLTSTAIKGSNINNIIHSSSAITNLNSLLQQWIEGNTVDSELSKIDEQLTYILAWQRLQQLMPSKSPSPISGVSTPQPGTLVSSSLQSSNTGKKGLLSVYLQQQGTSEVRARAVLCPLSGKGQAIPMPYRSMKLGTGAEMEVCLSRFGHCNFVSDHHATIFYDEMSRHFELLNYSEHGTTVDNVLYSCDFSDKPATTPKPNPLVASVREIVNKSSSSKNGSNNSKPKSDVEGQKSASIMSDEKLRMSARAYETYNSCGCKSSSSNLIAGNGAGWEGTALLHHGSYIKVGCLQFVFSIVDHAPDQPAPPTADSPSQATPSSAASTTTRFSSMPLLSSSQYIHNPPPSVSLLKSHLKTSNPP